MLLSTVSMLCRNSLDFCGELKIEGLIGITVDNDDVILVHINEKHDSPATSLTPSKHNESSDQVHQTNSHAKTNSIALQGQSVFEVTPYQSDEALEPENEEDSVTSEEPQPRARKRKRRKTSRNTEVESAPDNDVEDEESTCSGIVIKPEPPDDDFVVVNPEEPANSSDADGEGFFSQSSDSPGFAGFGGLASDQGFDPSGNAPPIGAFVAGEVKPHTATRDSEAGTSWNSITDSMDWASRNSSRRKTLPVAQGGSVPQDLVGTSFVFVAIECQRIFFYFVGFF